jgi:hypothetical protein
MKRVGFKEWAIVCEALGRGRQSIILRKGGIAEGREGFSFRHREFFLFPTWFHEQPEKVRDFEVEIPEPDPGKIEIKYAAKLDLCGTITSWPIAKALESLHVLRPEVIRERFEYDQAPGLHVALVRTFRLVPAWTFPNEKRYGGCRSWVNLPDTPAGFRFEAVLSDAEHMKRCDSFLKIMGDAAATVASSPSPEL